MIKNIQMEKTEKLNWKIIIGAFVLLMIFPPFLGLSIIIGYVCTRCKCMNKSDYLILMVCIAAYLASVNATKTPSGDQVTYYVAYNNVPRLGFWKSLIHIYGLGYYEDPNKTSISVEFMNGVYNYIGYYLTFGYYPLFEFLYSFVSYMLLFFGIYRFCLTFPKPHVPIVCGILIIGFFYYYFQFALHIQKQFFAQTIIMYVIGNYAYFGKLRRIDWVAIVCAIFTHQSMLFFIPFLVIKRFRQKMNKQTIALVLVITSLFIIYGPQMLGGSSQNSGLLTYGIGRFANSENDEDLTGRLAEKYLLTIALPLSLICIKQLMKLRKTNVESQSFVVVLASILLITVFAMFNQPLSQYRFFLMLLTFMPFVFPMAFRNIYNRDMFLKTVSYFMVLSFFVIFNSIMWTYAPEIDIIVKSPLLLIFSNYQNF